MRSQRRGAPSLTLSRAARGFDGWGLPTACRRAGGRIHDPAQAADKVDAGTCHGSLRPFLAHETETLVWRARPLSCVGVRTLPNDHAYVISMQPGRAWTHSWAPTAPAPHEVGFRQLMHGHVRRTAHSSCTVMCAVRHIAHARSCAPYGTQLMHGHVRRTAVQCVSVLTAAGGYRRTPGSEATMGHKTNGNAKRKPVTPTLDHFWHKQPRHEQQVRGRHLSRLARSWCAPLSLALSRASCARRAHLHLLPRARGS
jgi:hypothetical protein